MGLSLKSSWPSEAWSRLILVAVKLKDEDTVRNLDNKILNCVGF